MIVAPLKYESIKAWEKIKETAGNAFDVFFRKENNERILKFRLSGKCFAKGMKASFIHNYEREVNGESIEMMENPRGELKIQIE